MIFAIKPFEIHDGDGIRTTVFFKGCPLRCRWCHNPESFGGGYDVFYDESLCSDCMRCTSLCEANAEREGKHIFIRENCVNCRKCESVCHRNALESVGTDATAEEIAREVLKDEIFMKGSGGGVTFSGGEPLVQADFCVEIAKILKKRDINIAIDTCGAVSRSAIEKIVPYADTFIFDVKAIDEGVHIACTSKSNKEILENIRYVDSLEVPIEIRYPYVPTMNDGEVEKIAQFVKGLKHVKVVRVLAYHDFAESKYIRLGMEYPLPSVIPPTKEEIRTVAERMRALGVECAETF